MSASVERAADAADDDDEECDAGTRIWAAIMPAAAAASDTCVGIVPYLGVGSGADAIGIGTAEIECDCICEMSCCC